MAAIESDTRSMDTNRILEGKRSSNILEDKVHQRASLALNWAKSLEKSNNRIKELVAKSEDENLPATSSVLRRFKANKTRTESETEEDDDDYDDDEYSTEEDEEDTYDDDATEKERFDARQDRIVANIAPAQPKPVGAAIDPNISPDMLFKIMEHTRPLQGQLKRSYEAIVKLRENSDLRYEALEKKYFELKSAWLSTDDGSSSGNHKAELKEAYEAIIRLRDNSDLRYNLLESKFVDMKRAHSESEARNEQLEMEVEAMRRELLKVADSDVDFDRSVLSSSTTTSSIKKRREAIEEVEKERRLLMREFDSLCDKVESCEKCREQIPETTLIKVKEQLLEPVDYSESNTDEDFTRHQGTKALLAGMQEKDKKTPFKKFAHVHDPKSEQLLRGKKSQFVAAQSGIYCRIDHDVKKQNTGDGNQAQAPSSQTQPPPVGDPPEQNFGSKSRKDNPPKMPSKRPPSEPPSEADRSSAMREVIMRPQMPERRTTDGKPPIKTIDLQGSYRTFISDMNDSTMPQPMASTFDYNYIAPPNDVASPTGVADLPTKDAAKEDPPVQQKRDSAEHLSKKESMESQQNRSSLEGSGVTNSTRRTGMTNAAAGGDDDYEPSVIDEDNLVGRVKKIPPAKLDPAEKKAKREAALREAKAAAKNVRKKNKGNKLFDNKSTKDLESLQDDSYVGAEENSLISGLSNVSSVAEQRKPKKLFKNPFKRNKKSSLGGFTDGIPMEIIEEVPSGANRKIT